MARRKPPTTHGLAVVDKPAGVTSHDVVAMLRRRLGERQVGHAGTLDPDATGVLLVGVGKATRLLRFLTDLGKTYTAEIVFGSSTDSLDSTGVTTATYDMSGLTADAVQSAVRDHLTGPILQIPPMVSAVKIDGKRLHELAREGIEVERAPRPVAIHRFDIEPTADPLVYAATVECSKGTYIRTLADDLGRLCGGGAHLRNLRRVAVGSFTADAAVAPDEVQLLSLPEAVRDYPQVTVGADVAALVANGRVLDRGPLGFTGTGPWAVLGPDGQLLAMYEARGDVEAKPAVVVAV
ncbi:MAG: tRNA pseudouridine(55) synthase TruB [Actinomycetota bacterium]|nr:tRNA pseudouridine(55) synthase TruB [Actinomycetota bacterium]